MELQLQQLQKFWLGLPHAKLSRIIVVLSVVYVAFLFSQLFWLLWPVPQTQPLLPASQLYSQSSSGITSQGIVAQNLFGEANAKPDTKPQPVVSDAPETTLNVRLTGIVAVSQDDGAGLAIIESQGRQETYSVDAPITGTRAKLARVLPDRVILDVSGRFETLMLDGIEFSRTVAMPTKSKKIVNSTASPTPSRNELANRRQELLSDPGKLFDYIKIAPEQRNGEVIGYRLSPGKDPELFEQVGLKANDLAIAINGFQLTDMKQAMSAINELRTSTDANITIERDGQVMDVQFSL
ncbi:MULTISPECIES: type II secretion system protein GspC [Pseudoalteromonas]|uniref:type II secretion system protein GspC n=1 Tax=Pseudoalteromonas TaxID=53246 RepID=UPI00029A4FCC|nr:MULTISPECIES: type II secretion system protein GspC [Pseudoalteromonas]MBR8842532.1 type II secretion system protein GspC [Pseudoalteromonas sp. JC3]MCF2829467.1 type II secretion system protein GspC [Pseudoalteromonas sp. OF5H-5]MCF2830923.1 type II secretion system protein GspC [Pseudoalteromonas sp. DL2-H6]MCF2927122.1 type II secretion system protein GspC [Pseudoalteromonas sp. DL2-H1]MCG7554944.1 type II secretion system protein GspC [Pseudoalteromonas sp. Of11M-6]